MKRMVLNELLGEGHSLRRVQAPGTTDSWSAAPATGVFFDFSHAHFFAAARFGSFMISTLNARADDASMGRGVRNVMAMTGAGGGLHVAFWLGYGPLNHRA